MNLHECERKAQEEGYNTATFDLVNTQTGSRLSCKWLDAYFGMFVPDGQTGFTMVRDVEEMGLPLTCENFRAS